MNPFSIAGCPAEQFCNRTAEIGTLCNHLHSGTHTVLYAPRRYGKSSLARRVQEQLSDLDNIYVDLFPVTSLRDVATVIYREIAASLGKEAASTQTVLQRLAEFFRRVRFSLSIGADGNPSLDVSLADASPELCLKEVISSLDAWCVKNGRRAAIVLDEFQEICGLKEAKQIEAYLRDGMQQSTMVSFLFMGSRRRILRDMFENRSRPFYKSAISMELARIPAAEFTTFIGSRFAAAGRPIPAADAEAIVSLTEGYPYYTQKLALFHFNALESHSAAPLEQSTEMLIRSESSDFENIFVNLANNQKKVLKALARKPAGNIYSSDYLRETCLGAASSVKAAVGKLCELDLIEQQEGVWRTVDPLFGIWLRR